MNLQRERGKRKSKKTYRNQQQHTAKMGRWVHFIRRKTRSQLIGHKTLVISGSLERWEIVFAPIQLLLLVLLLDNHCCQWWQHGYFFFPFHVLKNAFAYVEVFFRNKIWIETNGRLHKNIFEQFFSLSSFVLSKREWLHFYQPICFLGVFFSFLLKNTLAIYL